MTDFIKEYAKSLTSQCPFLRSHSDLEAQLHYIVSPLEVELPHEVFTRAKETVNKICAYAHSTDFIQKLVSRLDAHELEILQLPVRNHAVLMAYDFHYNSEKKQLSLIEINTNGAAFLLALGLYKIFSDAGSPWGDPTASLRRSFENELHFASFTGTPRVAIIDENISQQKMRLEFLLYNHLFQSWGWNSQVLEMDQFKSEVVDLVYNRSTDFLLSSQGAQNLRKAYMKGQLIVSPHPREYLLLAAKERLIDFLEAKVSDTLIPTKELTAEADPDAIWEDKKSLIFKPKHSYGAKGVYKGQSISRKKFDEILTTDYLAQEFRQPGTIGEWKYDLRFYVYQNEIQLGAARLYQGQVTNFSTPGGGLARLKFT